MPHELVPSRTTTDGTPLRAGWFERVWFAPGAAVTLHALRVLIVATALVDLWRSRGTLERLPERAEVTWEPVSLLAFLEVSPPSSLAVGAVTGVAAAGCLLGLRRGARLAAVLGAVAYAILVMATNSLGKIDHSHQPLVVMLLVLSFAAAPRRDAPPSWRYRWPVQLCRAVLALMLAAAAWAKLSVGGLSWVASENLRNILVAEVLVLREVPYPDLALWIASEPWRWQLAAAGAIAGEVALVGALAVRRQPWRALLVVAGTGTVVAITLLMGLVGFPILVLMAALIDPDRLVDPARSVRSRAVGTAMVAVGLGVLAWTTFQDTEQWLTLLPLLAAAATVVLAQVRLPWVSWPCAGSRRPVRTRDEMVPNPRDESGRRSSGL